jgi:ubiquinone/menaquinone biosynthesis C-methylase UbiE
MTHGIVTRFLSRPRIFQWQQRLCNNYGAVKSHFAQYLDTSDKDILEIGCSTGNCASALVAMERNRYVGIDIVPGYIELARRRHYAGTFIEMNGRKLAFPNNSFDLILFIAALHHMEDQLVQACLAEVRRVIRSDGMVLCAEPVFTKGRAFSTLLLTLDRGKHIRTEQGYRALFDGFVIADTNYFDFSIHRFCSFILRPGRLARAA